jgi:hypothetical protein
MAHVTTCMLTTGLEGLCTLAQNWPGVKSSIIPASRESFHVTLIDWQRHYTHNG